VTASRPAKETHQVERRRRPRGAVRDGLVAAGLELARTGGPDAVVLREATRMVGVVPNAAYRHFADRDELLAAVCAAAMDELAARMAAGVARVPGRHGDPDAARGRLGAIGTAYLAFAREEPGLFATAFALPHQHAYGIPDTATGPDRTGPESTGPESTVQDRTPLGQLRTALDELADAGLLDRSRRDGIEYPVWATVHGLAVLAGSGPLREVPEAARHHLDELIFGFIQDGLAGG
jgi:AcrR family transcriptional regulator